MSSDMTPRLQPQEEGPNWAYVLPVRHDRVSHVNDMMTWRFADDVHTVITAMGRARAGEYPGYEAVMAADRLARNANDVRDEILVRAAEGKMSLGTMAMAMDAPRSTAQSRLEAAQGRTWRAGWLMTNEERQEKWETLGKDIEEA